jgi:hypothetical protein
MDFQLKLATVGLGIRNIAFIVISTMIIGVVVVGLTVPQAARAHETGDFQIVKATETVAWRLNRKSGEIAVCKLDGDTMLCSSSTTAVTKGQESYDAYKTDKQNSEKNRQDHEMAVLDKVMDFFKTIMTLMMGNEGN